jgi:hypothetical protein
MSELDDFARDLRAAVDDVIPVRHVDGRSTLAAVKRRKRARTVRGAVVATACVALLGVGLTGMHRLDVHVLTAASAQAPAPYEGGLLTAEHFRAMSDYLASCPLSGEPTAVPEPTPEDVQPGAREHPPAVRTEQDGGPCAQQVNFRRAETALEQQTRVRELDREDVFAEFVQCMAAGDVAVAVTESDTLDTVTAKAKDALAAGSVERSVNACLDGYTPRLYG